MKAAERSLVHSVARATTDRRSFLARSAEALAGMGVVVPLLTGLSMEGVGAQAVFRWSSSADATRLDPMFSSQIIDLAVYSNVYDQLVRRTPDLLLEPGLATEWALLDDLTWQFKLRPGVAFHNGDTFSAADVKFTFDRVTDPATNAISAGEWSTVERVEVVDDLTVNFVTKHPDPLLPARHTGRGMWILPSAYVQSVGDEGFNDRPVGTGPYRVVEWVKDDHLTLEINQDYWDGPAAVSSIEMRPRPDVASRIATLESGEAELIDAVLPDQVEVIESDGIKAASTLYAGLWLLLLNANVPPLDNKLVRQALSHAVDRDAIVDSLWMGMANVPTGPILPGELGYDPDLPPLPFDPDLARELLEQAGYQGEPIVYETTQGAIANDSALAQVVVSMWSDVGVNASIEVIDNAVKAERQRNQTVKGGLISVFSSTLLDPDGMMWRLMSPGSPYRYVEDTEFDRLGEEARYSLDAQFRTDSYRRMTSIFLDLMPWILLLQPSIIYGLQTPFDLQPHPTYQLSFRNGDLALQEDE